MSTALRGSPSRNQPNNFRLHSSLRANSLQQAHTRRYHKRRTPEFRRSVCLSHQQLFCAYNVTREAIARQRKTSQPSMCFHFVSWNACPVCSTTFNRRRNLVPCWNGDIASPLSSSTSSSSTSSSSPSTSTSSSSFPSCPSSLRRPRAAIHLLRHHGLRCRSGHYSESDSETYTDRPCGACAARIAWNNTRGIGRGGTTAAARRDGVLQLQSASSQWQVVEQQVSYGGGPDRMPLGHIDLRLAHVDHVMPQRSKAECGVPQRGRRGP
ncbi:hypothetical protein JDV02_002498 [Purpureocillium takamizusanense]|uniref:Uncharacterized protein n=1 Tax=Purpureocillium takamizusanense TaxID=2060973 RepID=A0A9Q8QBQ5_9HYPO|nr:uncharacterized protein JDV02_002498 [Purpureocillium takamizusanense]UNI16021.1 hypothetical protein JDV02_002498 [Purpureocillium takamizusanense]